MELVIQLPNHSYTITIQKNGFSEAGSWVSNLWNKQKICLITDETVDALYGDQLVNQLTIYGFEVIKAVLPPGEESKSLRQAEKLYQLLIQHNFTRSDGIIALGGGVIGDLAGFTAATFMRGIHYLQIPTTLLAQLDSSIGGKTAVNMKEAKNIIGAFWQPEGVLIDPNTLLSLEKRRISEGIAEIIKYAAIADRNLWVKLTLLENREQLIEDAEAIILSCLKIKKSVVETDEFDNGQRLILNFGHTIGHAVEKTAGYGTITHGEAVAIGMIQINRIAEQKHLSPIGTTNELIKMVEKFQLPATTEPWDEELLYQALIHDKKARGESIKIILLKEIGEAYIHTIHLTEMKEFLQRGE
ncbi:3-dehydroquinate synthase [Enterococcus faecalis 13-SD-W-01]|nr:3-dehydroquinate synthase [Enterococcus faecalis 13-SD-W-01]